MVRGRSIFAFTALALAAMAQAKPPESERSATSSAPVPQAIAPQLLRNYQAHCPMDAPAARLGADPQFRVVFVAESRPFAQFAVCLDTRQAAELTPINELDTALVFMAYKPFAPLWPAAEARWGSDLAMLRESLRNEAEKRNGDNDLHGRLMSRANATTIDRAHALIRIGYFDDAATLLERREAEVSAKEAKAGARVHFDLVMLAIARAGIESIRHSPASAADYLASFDARYAIAPDYRVNLAINRAAYLVEAGQADEALALVLPAFEEFKSFAFEARSYGISGSDREFAWIIGCAYWQLDKNDEARPYIEAVDSAVEQPVDLYLAATKRSMEIRLRMHSCMNDRDGYFSAWENNNEHPLSAAWLEFQAGGDGIAGLGRRAWVPSDPASQNVAAAYRQLPASYAPALRRWRTVGD